MAPRLTLSLVALAALAAGCGKQGDSSSSSSLPSTPSGPRHIDGGIASTFHGAAFDIPKTWKSVPQGDALVLAPDGANPTGLVEELYILAGDPAVKSLDGPDSERSLATAVQQLQPGAAKKSGPETRKFGDLDGRAWVFGAQAQNGKDVEVRVFAFLGNGVCALIALGYPEALSKRSGEVDAILGSLSKPAAAAGGGAGVRPELAGQWIWITNVNANDGGRQTDTTLNLNGDGTYEYIYHSVSTNPFGAAWGSDYDKGTWSATDDSITFTSRGGSSRTSRLEKRNHPKNTGDPMIVLDGKTFVTATRRQPW